MTTDTKINNAMEAKMKFEVGSQWETRGGWRAVVVGPHPRQYKAGDEREGLPLVWHETQPFTPVCHLEDGGRRSTALNGEVSGFDLIKPYKEPVTHEGWVNIYRDPLVRLVTSSNFHKTKEQANATKTEGCIACIKVKFTEGEGLS